MDEAWGEEGTHTTPPLDIMWHPFSELWQSPQNRPIFIKLNYMWPSGTSWHCCQRFLFSVSVFSWRRQGRHWPSFLQEVPQCSMCKKTGLLWVISPACSTYPEAQFTRLLPNFHPVSLSFTKPSESKISGWCRAVYSKCRTILPAFWGEFKS